MVNFAYRGGEPRSYVSCSRKRDKAAEGQTVGCEELKASVPGKGGINNGSLASGDGEVVD